MLTNIHDRLMLAKERLRQKQKLEAMLHEAQAALEDVAHPVSFLAACYSSSSSGFTDGPGSYGDG